MIKKLIEYVIIGTGKDKFELPDSYFERFKKNGIKVDVVPTVIKNF
jgi:NADH dehydrogenase [ubiquinone] 1 alpha subcomplex assembly factor 3